MHRSSLRPVEGRKNMYRDPKTNSIVYTDDDEYTTYIERRKSRQEREELIETTAKELQDVKSEISEIKDLLLKLTSSINN